MRRLRVTLAVVAIAGMVGPVSARAADHPASSPNEIAEAAKRTRPGDTITMRDGAWTDAEMRFEAEGEPGRPITLRASAPGRAVIGGRSRLRIAGRHLVVDGLDFRGAHHKDDLISFRRDSGHPARHCRLTNCSIIDCNDPAASGPGSASTRWVSLYGDHNRVDHCMIRGKTTLGATLVVWLAGGPADHLIDRNYFGPRPELKRNGGETIRVGDSQTSQIDARVVVESNCFVECNGEAEIVSNKSCGNIYRHNTFLRCAGALTLRHGDRCIVEGNYFLGEGARSTGGVRIIGGDHRVTNNYFADLRGTDHRAALSMSTGLRDSPAHGYFPANRALVAFNTFAGCAQAFAIGVAGKDIPPVDLLPPEDGTIANNLVVAARPPIVHIQTPAVRFRWRGNLAGDDIPTQDDPPGFRRARLTMRADGDGILRPEPGGPASGAAEGDSFAVREDIDGQPRGDRKDVGCDQASDAPVMHRPLRPADVGPVHPAR